jgi:hypothetical protein
LRNRTGSSMVEESRSVTGRELSPELPPNPRR